MKTTPRFHFTAVRMTVIKKANKKIFARMWEKGNPYTLLLGMYSHLATVEVSVKIPRKTKNKAAYTTSGYISKVL